MTNLSFQSQDCKITLAEGLEEYRTYLQANGKNSLLMSLVQQLLEIMMQLMLFLA